MARLLFVLVLAASVCLPACQFGAGLMASAGADFSVKMGEAPTFDGCGSTGRIVNYKWTITGAPSAMAKDTGKVIREVDASCRFTLESAMGIQEEGVWTVELEVRDASGSTSTDTVMVTVTP